MTAVAYAPRPTERSPEQRLEALRRANGIRIRRAEIKRLMKTGAITATAVLTEVEDATARMKVKDVLRSLPKTGPVKADRVLRIVRISDAKTVGGISTRQQGELLRYLEGR